MPQKRKDEIDKAMTGGLVFHKASSSGKKHLEEKVKTKARKKGYITGAHGSDSAKMKAGIRTRRKNRNSQKKNRD